MDVKIRLGNNTKSITHEPKGSGLAKVFID